MAGQGTIALEILRDLPGVDMIFVPAGGGGLISGVAACAKQINPRIQIIGVQAEGAPAIANSFRTGERTPSDTVHTIADGIAVRPRAKRPLSISRSMWTALSRFPMRDCFRCSAAARALQAGR